MNNISYYLRGIELMQMVRKIVEFPFFSAEGAEENDRRRRGGVNKRTLLSCTCNDGNTQGTVYIVCPNGRDYCDYYMDPFLLMCCYKRS